MNIRDPQHSELRPLAFWLHAAAAELRARVPPPLASAPASSSAAESTPESRREATRERASKPAAPRITPPPARSPIRWPWQRGAWALASLACISVLVAVFTGSQPAPHSHEFVAVAGAERWLRLDAQPAAGQAADTGATAWLVQTEMPQERLAAFGLPYDPGRAAMPVRAELLMRASGEVLALRIVD